MVCPSVVGRCKEILWKQLNQNSDLRHLANEEGQIKSRLVDAFDRRVSTSILVVGPTGSGKRELVEKVMIDYCSEGIKNSKPVSVARINGLVHLNDNQATMSLADQLLLRPCNAERNINIANEDLENHFKQCRFNSQPAVIIVEEFQEFSKRSKQILIYSLLDLMHREDLLFVMIGTTRSANVNYRLEKRVLSRLNAQFVYIAPSSAKDICGALSQRLSLPSQFGNETGCENAIRLSIYNEFRLCFNAEVERTFGSTSHVSDSPFRKDIMEIPASRLGDGSTHLYASKNKSNDDEREVRGENNTRKRGIDEITVGTVYDDVLQCVENGNSLRHFFKAAQMAVAALSCEADCITGDMFRKALQKLVRPSLISQLSSLCENELNLAAAVGRLRMRITGFGSSSALATGTTASGGIDMRIGSVAGKARTVLGNSNSCRETALRSFTVHDVMDEFSRISRVVAMQIFSEEYVISSLLSLVRAGIIVLNNGHDDDIPRDLVTMRTVVNFLPAEHEFAAAFRKGYIAEGTSSSSSITQNRSAGIILRVSNRVRRAVLHPQEQILIDGIR